MSTRSAADTLARIFLAFLREGTWRQADLARECEVTTPALRKRLRELQAAGMPLEQDSEPANAVWSVPRGWFPGGVTLDLATVTELLRLLSRAPRSAARERVLRRLLGALGRRHDDPSARIVVPQASDAEEAHLQLAEEAAQRRVPLRLRYLSLGRGTIDPRHVSVHRVLPGPPARIAGLCHEDGRLKWFRLESFVDARLDETVPFRDAEAETADRFVRASLGGYHAPEPPQEHTFFVRDPEARWVERNLPGAMQKERTCGGTRFVVETAGLPVLARFVVGLGDAAHAETRDLATLVRELARGSLAQHAAAPVRAGNGSRKGVKRAVATKKARAW